MSDTVQVRLGSRPYDVRIGDCGLRGLPEALRALFGARRSMVVTNTTIAALYAPFIDTLRTELSSQVCVIDDGEKFKTLDTWEHILASLLKAKLDRRAYVIALGGGVVGDMAGFAAACFLRGVAVVQVPTTLLAMVDSSVGGKTGVNHALGKNLIGAFHQPSLVWVDTVFLTTLPPRELRAGYAELFKYAFIGGREVFNFVSANHDSMAAGDMGVVAQGVRLSIAIKAGVVERDEHESGERALLNFGHTFAHAMERVFGYSGVLHGEAVWWGMACACELGRRTGTTTASSQAQLRALADRMALPPLPSRPSSQALLEAMGSDKKAKDGALRFVLPVEPGLSIVRGDIATSDVLATLDAVLGQ